MSPVVISPGVLTIIAQEKMNGVEFKRNERKKYFFHKPNLIQITSFARVLNGSGGDTIGAVIGAVCFLKRKKTKIRK